MPRSCLNQQRRSKALERVRREENLAAFVFAGDNGYHDTPSCGVPWNEVSCRSSEWLAEVARWLKVLLRWLAFGAEREDALRRTDDYRALFERHVGPLRAARPDMPILATWDDHDLGANDASSDYAFVEESKRAFLAFWRRPYLELGQHDTECTTIYAAYRFGHVHLLLLDVRSFRTPLARTYGSAYKATRLARLAMTSRGPCPHDEEYAQDFQGTILGSDQWAWLERQLAARTADLLVVVSSIQVLRPHDGSETWSNFPHERQRLLDLLSNRTAVILSGDVHYAEVAKFSDNLYEVTSSGLTETWPCIHDNPYRIPHSDFNHPNFGVLDFDPSTRDLALELKDQRGATTFRLDLGSFTPASLSAASS